MKHIVIFSHGFGNRKDDRGLFTDIASQLENVGTIMFDYNKVNEADNALIMRPFSQQAKILEEVIAKTKKENSNAIIDLICHSQGCIIPAMLNLNGIRKAILITPPATLSIERTTKYFKDRPGTEINIDGITKLARRDGSMTIVLAGYWKELEKTNPIDLYNNLARQTEVITINANQDEVLSENEFNGLSSDIKIVNINGNHDFTGEFREGLLRTIKEIL